VDEKDKSYEGLDMFEDLFPCSWGDSLF